MPSNPTASDVAIILPVFNTEKYLGECLKSILSQKYQNFDIYAVDDGSTDNSSKILEEFSNEDRRVKIIRQQNGGLSVARNTALRVIEKIPSYKYISFVDSDDTLDQEFLSILVSTMEQTSADVSVCGYSKIYDDGSIKEIPKSSHKTIIETIDFLKLIFSTKEWLGDRAAGGMVWKNLYRASTVKGLRFNPDREVLEDEPYQLLVAQRASTYAVVKRSLYHYRQRSSNDALCKQDNFIRRQIAGRKECLEYGRKISEKAWLLCLASYVSSLIIPLKSKPDDSIALDSYREDMKKAKKLGYINTKYYILFLLFTRHPLISGLYRKIRDFSMKIR